MTCRPCQHASVGTFGAYGVFPYGGPAQSAPAAPGAHGAPEQASGGIDPHTLKGYVDALAPTLLPQLLGENPRVQVEVLRERLRVALVQGAPIGEIRELQGRLRAAEEQVALARETSQVQRQWTQIGQVAAIAGVGLVGVGIVYGIIQANRAARRT